MNLSLGSTYIGINNVSSVNGSFTNTSSTSLYVTNSYIANVSGINASFTNVSIMNLTVNGTLFGETSSVGPNASFTNVSVLGNFSMPSTAYMNVSNASFTNVSINSLTINTTKFDSYYLDTTIANITINGGGGALDINDSLGHSVAIDALGTTFAVGAPFDWVRSYGTPNSNYGYVKIYNYKNSSWQNISTITTNVVGERFGNCCALTSDGRTLAVGSFGESTKIYEYNNTSWVNVSTFTDSRATSIAFNMSSTNSSFILAVGNITAANNNGVVNTYLYKNSTWTNIGIINGINSERLGYACALNRSDIIAISSYSNNQVRILNYKNSVWGNTSTITGGALSCALNADGTIIAFGNLGKLNIFQNKGLGWINMTTINRGGEFGSSCALNYEGNIVAVGSPTANSYSGLITTYEYNDTSWVAVNSITGGTKNENGLYFGSACALNANGNILLGGSTVSTSINIKGVALLKNFTSSSISNLAIITIDGYNASINNTSNVMNTVISDLGLNKNTYGGYNTVVGMNSMISNISGNQNSAFGSNSLVSSTGTGNTAIGAYSEQYMYNVNSNYNTALGFLSRTSDIDTSTSVTNSTAIGANTNCSGYSYSTAIGFNASNTENNQIVLGNATETVFIPGNFSMPSTAYMNVFNASFINVSITNGTFTNIETTNISSKTTMSIGGALSGTSAIFTGQVQSVTFRSTSDYKLKENIFYLNEEFNIEKLKPCKFNFINSSIRQIGFIAQDVEQVIPLSVTTTDGLKGIDYSSITAASIITIKKLLERVDILENLLKKHNIT
jgi:hypothetical protein